MDIVCTHNSHCVLNASQSAFFPENLLGSPILAEESMRGVKNEGVRVEDDSEPTNFNLSSEMTFTLPVDGAGGGLGTRSQCAHKGEEGNLMGCDTLGLRE